MTPRISGWPRLIELVRKGFFKDGMAVFEGGEVGDFAGPISDLQVTRENFSITATPCLFYKEKDWEMKYPEGHLLGTRHLVDLDHPNFHEEDGSVTWFVRGGERHGRYYLLPKGHKHGEELRQLALDKTPAPSEKQGEFALTE
jgi:hypothetical protein